MCEVPLLRAVCRECYSEPRAVYEKLKRLGMDLVTVTDHDSIDAVEELRTHPDFFLSEEVSCVLPGGTRLHVGVYDLGDRDHIEIQRRRTDFESLLAWLRERKLFFTANHVFSRLTGRRRLEDFWLFETAFPGIETQNGHMLARANRHAAMLCDLASASETGGSDAHVMASVGCAYTVVPGARDKQEFLAGLRRGLGRVRGDSGGFPKLTRDVLAIGAHMVRKKPWTVVMAAPLAITVPFVTAANYGLELLFARRWMARYLHFRSTRSPSYNAPAPEAAV